MYSLAIIMVEVLTHEAPFNDYLDYLEVDEVLDAVAGLKKITAQLPQAWPISSSSALLRPTVPEDCDPAYAKVGHGSSQCYLIVNMHTLTAGGIPLGGRCHGASKLSASSEAVELSESTEGRSHGQLGRDAGEVLDQPGGHRG